MPERRGGLGGVVGGGLLLLVGEGGGVVLNRGDGGVAAVLRNVDGGGRWDGGLVDGLVPLRARVRGAEVGGADALCIVPDRFLEGELAGGVHGELHGHPLGLQPGLGRAGARQRRRLNGGAAGGLGRGG